MTVARQAYLDLEDPTQGATHFQFLTNPDRSNMRFEHGTAQGIPLRTQSGPFNNSFEKGDVKGPRVFINTYGQK
jgi:hypothetical protein